MTHVALQPHEHEGHLVFTEHGASPYWAWGAVVRDGFDWNANDVVVTVDGDEWEVDVYFQNGGLDARDEDPVDGQLNEYRIKARPVAPDDRRKVSVKIAPRWKGLTSGGDGVSTPFEYEKVDVNGETVNMPNEGVDVQYQMSNLETPKKPAELVPAFFQALADRAGEYFDHEYFQTPHLISNVKAIEGYGRHLEETQDDIVSSDGVMMRMFHLLGEQEGSLLEYYADNQETVGHLHKVKIQDGIEKMLPGHQYAKQFKSYYPKDIVESGPLSEPKFGVLVVGGWQDETVYFHELDDVWQEIEEAAVNVLSWAGVQTGADGPWVADDHFEPEPSDVEIERYQDPLPAIEASQDAHVVKLLTDATDADQDILEQLSADGGEAHHAVLEKAADRGSSTVYRMLQRLPELVESDNGYISFASEKLYQDVSDILQRTEAQIEHASDAVANMLGIEADVLDGATNGMRRFMQKYAADVDVDGGTLEVKLNAIVSEIQSAYDDYPKIWVIVDELRRALRGSRYRPQARRVTVSFDTPRGEHVSRPLNSPRLAKH